MPCTKGWPTKKRLKKSWLIDVVANSTFKALIIPIIRSLAGFYFLNYPGNKFKRQAKYHIKPSVYNLPSK